MEDKDFEEWWLKSYNKQRSKSISKGEKIAFKVAFREGAEFGKDQEKRISRWIPIYEKQYEKQERDWQKKVEELRKWIWKNNTIPLKGTNLNLATMDGGWVNGLKLGEAIDRIFKTNNTKGEGNRTEEDKKE